MTEIYKFSDYTCYRLYPETLIYNNSAGQLPSSIYVGNWDRQLYTIVPVPKNTPMTTLDNNSVLSSQRISVDNYVKGTLQSKDKLFIHPSCTIPRAKVYQKYLRALKAENADTCIVPSISSMDNSYTEAYHTIIFANKEKKKLYFVREWRHMDNYFTVIKKACTLGIKVKDINPTLCYCIPKERPVSRAYPDDTYTKTNWNDFLESTVIFYGPSLRVPAKGMWIADLLYGKLHNVVTEDVVLASLGSEENKITRTVLENIRQMLNSKDKATIVLGLKTLAELDYEKYRNTVVLLLNSVSSLWSCYKVDGGTSVKFMLNTLGMWKYVNRSFTPTITEDDYDFIKEDVEKDLQQRLQDFIMRVKQSYPFMDLDLDVVLKKSPKIDKKQ